MEIADRRLTDPDLTPAALARQLNVSASLPTTGHHAPVRAGATSANGKLAGRAGRGRPAPGRLKFTAARR
jgi:hypothetical protein